MFISTLKTISPIVDDGIIELYNVEEPIELLLMFINTAMVKVI